ncbi:PglL family O-oligosaccharyltransferase [Variovorax terrae]|uniref:Wzy polymerase domain-containing protein n=1 Tax=Variovorax terrae TaxID=2923278 RepID=A0A9X1VZL5_9BURK|nr:Wzy polymerase domain-containing protein [Variovorax terrae]MCJ0765804.1 Wzy polymerase domain-containing protein [Variovorax terrae]
MAVPWLNPFAPGPSPAVLGLCVAWACAACLLFLVPWSTPWLTAKWLLACALVVVLHGLSVEVLATVAGLAMLLVFAGFGLTGARRGQQVLEPLVAGLLLAALLSACAGLLQYFGLEQGLAGWVNHAQPREAFANLRQRNQFATLTVIGLAAVLWFRVRGQLALHAGWMVLLLVAGNVVSASRTGLFQIVLLLVLAWCWRASLPKPCRTLLAATVPMYLAVWLLLQWILDAPGGAFMRFDLQSEGCASRLVLWRNVLDLIGQRPVWGWGVGELDYAHYITLYPGERFCSILDNAHNLPLHMAVELGVPAALLICGGLVWLVLRARPWRETQATRQLAWSVLAVIMLHSFLEYPLWYTPFQMAFGLSLGLLLRPAGAAAGDSWPPGARTAQRVCAALLLAACAAVYGDYSRISQIYLPPEARDPAYRDDTLRKLQNSWFFQNQVRFAELSVTSLTRENAAQQHALAKELLHYSPEPKVIERLIESAVMLGLDDEALFHLVRYQKAFPAEYARWAQLNADVAKEPPWRGTQ